METARRPCIIAEAVGLSVAHILGTVVHVLVVDDDPLVRWSIAQTLTAAGDEPTEADSGAAALRALADAPPPDVVLLDYRLPDSADFSLLARVKRAVPNSPVILMTGESSPEILAGAIPSGAWAVALKPFDMDAIRTLVHDAHTGRDAMKVTLTKETPDALIDRARAGMLTKHALATLLAPERRPEFLRACAAIERKYTEACTATHDPCVESGCSLEGEICLEPVLRAGDEYHKACAAEWLKLFVDPRNRTFA